VQAQEADRASPLSFTRDLLALRRTTAALRSGPLTFLDAPDGVLAYTRSAGSRAELLVTLNLTGRPVPIDRLLAQRPSWERVLSTARTTDAGPGDPTVLAPDEGAVWKAL
jgi:hypothetical protein